jgi:hypothetical protein
VRNGGRFWVCSSTVQGVTVNRFPRPSIATPGIFGCVFQFRFTGAWPAKPNVRRQPESVDRESARRIGSFSPAALGFALSSKPRAKRRLTLRRVRASRTSRADVTLGSSRVIETRRLSEIVSTEARRGERRIERTMRLCGILSVIQRHGRLRTRSDHEDMIRVKPVENPDIVPRHTSHVRPPRRKARRLVPWTRTCFSVLERADGCEYCSIRRRVRPHSDSRERAAKGGAQPRDSSGHGDSPVSMARLSCSGVSSM